MATNLDIDEHLIAEAVRLGGHKSKKAAVTQALIEYTRRLEQMNIIALFGKVTFDPGYEYKSQRAKR